MKKNLFYGFVLGVTVVFAAVSAIIMTPQNMLRWINSPSSSQEKVDRALTDSSSQLARFNQKVTQLNAQLAAQEAEYQQDIQKYTEETKRLRQEVKQLGSKKRDGTQQLSKIVRQMEKEIEYLSSRLNVSPKKESTSVTDLEELKSKYLQEIASLNKLLSSTEDKLVTAMRNTEDVKRLRKVEQEKAKRLLEQEQLENKFALKQLEENISSVNKSPVEQDNTYDTSRLLGERKLFSNQTQIFYGGKLAIDLRRLVVGNYCDVRIRSFINESESKTVSLRKGEPVKVKMANEDFIFHYFYSYDRPVPTCVFNVFEM